MNHVLEMHRRARWKAVVIPKRTMKMTAALNDGSYQYAFHPLAFVSASLGNKVVSMVILARSVVL